MRERVVWLMLMLGVLVLVGTAARRDVAAAPAREWGCSGPVSNPATGGGTMFYHGQGYAVTLEIGDLFLVTEYECRCDTPNSSQSGCEWIIL